MKDVIVFFDWAIGKVHSVILLLNDDRIAINVEIVQSVENVIAVDQSSIKTNKQLTVLHLHQRKNYSQAMFL